jgi:hypothetical protein
MPELTITSPYVHHCKVVFNTFTMAIVDLNLCRSRLYPPVRDFQFGPRKCGSPTLEIIIAELVIKPPVPFPQLPQELALRQVHCSTHLKDTKP